MAKKMSSGRWEATSVEDLANVFAKLNGLPEQDPQALELARNAFKSGTYYSEQELGAMWQINKAYKTHLGRPADAEGLDAGLKDVLRNNPDSVEKYVGTKLKASDEYKDSPTNPVNVTAKAEQKKKDDLNAELGKPLPEIGEYTGHKAPDSKDLVLSGDTPALPDIPSYDSTDIQYGYRIKVDPKTGQPMMGPDDKPLTEVDPTAIAQPTAPTSLYEADLSGRPAAFNEKKPELKVKDYVEDPLVAQARATAAQMMTGELSAIEQKALDRKFEIAFNKINEQAAARGTPTGAVMGLQTRAAQDLAMEVALTGQSKKEQGISAALSIAESTKQAKRALLDEALSIYGVDSKNYNDAYQIWKNADDTAISIAYQNAKIKNDNAASIYGMQSDQYKTSFASFQQTRQNYIQTKTAKYSADVSKAVTDFELGWQERKNILDEKKTKFDADMMIYNADYAKYINDYKVKLETAKYDKDSIQRVITNMQNDETIKQNQANAAFDKWYKIEGLKMEAEKTAYERKKSESTNILGVLKDTISSFVPIVKGVDTIVNTFKGNKAPAAQDNSGGYTPPPSPADLGVIPDEPLGANSGTGSHAPAANQAPALPEIPANEPSQTFAPTTRAPGYSFMPNQSPTLPTLDENGTPATYRPGSFSPSFRSAPGGN